jgi:hypothetical protein
MPLLPSRFRPARGLANPVAQTVYPVLLRRAPRAPTRRERWETPDGDFLDVDLLEPARPRGFLVLVHGLEGSAESPFVRGMLTRAEAASLGALALNFRNCSGEPNRLARSYHSGETGDLRLVVAQAVERWPGLGGAVVGFSLGGNVTLKWLAEEGRGAPDPIRAAVAVSVPFDLALCGATIDEPRNFWIRENFLRPLKAKALEKAARFPGLFDVPAIRAARTLRAFDDLVTAPLHGFRDAAEYWTRSSSGPRLGPIARPALLLSAEDDPIIPARCHPVSIAREHPHLHLERSERGGHVGFVGGSVLAPRFYAEERAMEFALERIEA